jgi:hypothetical protein
MRGFDQPFAQSMVPLADPARPAAAQAAFLGRKGDQKIINLALQHGGIARPVCLGLLDRQRHDQRISFKSITVAGTQPIFAKPASTPR